MIAPAAVRGTQEYDATYCGLWPEHASGHSHTGNREQSNPHRFPGWPEVPWVEGGHRHPNAYPMARFTMDAGLVSNSDGNPAPRDSRCSTVPTPMQQANEFVPQETQVVHVSNRRRRTKLKWYIEHVFRF